MTVARPTTTNDKHRLSALKAARDEGRERLVERYSTNLLAFARDVVCYHEKKNLILDEVHGEMCRILQNAYWGLLEKKVHDDSIHGVLINVPRGCFKSTICTIAFPLWILLQNRPDGKYQPPTSFNGKRGCDQRINLAHETDAESQKYLGLISHHLHKNPRLRSLYGDGVFWRKKTEGRWANWELNIPWRQDYTAREANITTTSLRSSIAGGHFDVTIWDDLFTEKTINEESGIDRVMDYYRKYIPVAHLPSLLIVIGTRKHDADLYGYIQEKEKNKWHVLVEKAWRTPADIANGKREFFFPQKLSREVLLDIIDRMGRDHFATEYQNEPLDEATAPFQSSWFNESLFDIPVNEDDLKKFLTNKTCYTLSDPAISGKNAACLATIVTVAVDHKGHYWIVDAWGERGVGEDPNKYIDELYRQSKTYNSLWTGVEEVGFSKMIKWAADQRGRETGEYLNWLELRPQNRSKEARILGLRPLARAGGIHVQKQHLQILTEFVRYPKGKSRDFIDAIAYTMDVAIAPDAPKEDAPKPTWNPADVMLHRAQQRGIKLPWDDNPSGPKVPDAYYG